MSVCVSQCLRESVSECVSVGLNVSVESVRLSECGAGG